MTNLTNEKHISLLRAANRVLVETAEQERERGSQDLWNRLRDLEFQKVLDNINRIINNGAASPKERLETVAELIGELYYYDRDDDEEEDYEVDGQSQVEFGGKSPVDVTPNTK
jgi:hypothetical protein